MASAPPLSSPGRDPCSQMRAKDCGRRQPAFDQPVSGRQTGGLPPSWPWALPPQTATEPPIAPGSPPSMASAPPLSSSGRNPRSQKRAKDRGKRQPAPDQPVSGKQTNGPFLRCIRPCRLKPPLNTGTSGSPASTIRGWLQCCRPRLCRKYTPRPSAPQTWLSFRPPSAPPRAARWGTPRQVALKQRAALATHPAGFPPAPPRPTERARKDRYLLLDPIPNEGGSKKRRPQPHRPVSLLEKKVPDAQRLRADSERLLFVPEAPPAHTRTESTFFFFLHKPGLDYLSSSRTPTRA